MKILAMLTVMALVGCGPSVSEKNGKGDNNTSSNNGTNNGTNNKSNNGSNNVSNGSNNNTTVLGNSCLNVSPAEIDFGTVVIGQRSEAIVSVTNCGNAMFETSIVAAPPFSPEVNSAFIDPGDSFDLTLVFEPTDEGPATSVMTLTQGVVTFDMQLTGTGTAPDETCPIARPVASDGAGNAGDAITVIQGSTFTLDGNGSQAINGQLSVFEWKTNGNEITIDDSSAPTTTARAVSIGTHVVELVVTDSLGESNCDTAEVSVTVIERPMNGLSITLTWDSPADADQTDANGTDLDLHFLHPNGEWNQAPWDCFWNNPRNEWGALGSADDPNYVQEDTDGLGPEETVIDGYEPVVYQVGVYYFADRGFGPSYATVQVRRDGMLISEQKDVFMEKTGIFLRAGTFDGATNVYSPIATITDSFPVTP